MKRRLPLFFLIALGLLLVLSAPSKASAQYLDGFFSAGPDPFDEYDDIDIDFEFEWSIPDFGCFECWDNYANVAWQLYSDGGLYWTDSCYYCWPSGDWSVWGFDSGPGYSMETTTYYASAVVLYFDWSWESWAVMSYGATQVVRAVGPQVGGQCGGTVWWLDDGADAGGTPTTLTLTSDAGEDSFWLVVHGGDKLRPFNPFGTIQVEASGIMSEHPGDIGLVAYRRNSNGNSPSGECHIDARKPSSLTPKSNVEDPPPSTGSFCNDNVTFPDFPLWHSFPKYDAVDSLASVMSGTYGSNEQWAAPLWTKDENFPNSTWDITAPEGGRVASEVMDHLSIGGNIFPLVSCQAIGRDFRVVYRDQFIRIGSPDIGVGVLVQVDQVEFRRGHGGHFWISSPPQ